MDDPNITMEEYIRLAEEKAQKREKVFNWETAKYGKIWYDNDIHDLRSVETEFPAISFNDDVSSKTLSYEPTISSLNDEIDFRVSFDDSDDEDYTVPAVSCLDDLDFFKDFENEFSAIIYNDAPTSKLDLLPESILNSQHIDEFDLNNETSLSEYDEEEQNIWLYHLVIRDTYGLVIRLIEYNILDFEDWNLDMTQDLAKRRRMVYTGDDGQEELILEFFSTCRIEDEMGLDVAGTLCFQMGGARRSMPWRQFNALHSSHSLLEPKMISST
ncbi:hypothetical protein Tco_0336831 [Tanacetum coccineum]